MMFAAALAVARRNRTVIRPIPVSQPPLWRLMVEEAIEAARDLIGRLRGR